jgi:hypothetical protein
MTMDADQSSVVVCGSRDWPEDKLWFVTAAMIEHFPHGALVITGGARGVDAWAYREAVRLKWPTKVIPADWDRYGKRAGFLRNIAMLDEGPEKVLAFHVGNSKGTAHTIREAHRRGIPFKRYTLEDL